MYGTAIESHLSIIPNVLLAILRSEDSHPRDNMTLIAKFYDTPPVKSLLSLIRSLSVSTVISTEHL